MWRNVKLISLIKIEFLKLISSKANQLACLLVFIYILIAVIGSIYSVTYYELDDNGNVNIIKGFDAIREKEKRISEISGYLDVKKINDIVKHYQDLKVNDSLVGEDGELTDAAWVSYWVQYLDIQRIFAIAFSELHTFDMRVIDNLSIDEAKELYKARVSKINEYLELYYDKPKFTSEDKIIINGLAESMHDPIYYTFFDGWAKVLDNYFTLNIVIVLILCFCVSNIFTEDFSSKMILIVFPTARGKDDLVGAKIIASLLFTLIMYIIFNIVFACGILSTFGVSGWNSEIQIHSKNWLSIYNLTFSQAYILALLIGLTVSIFIAVLTLLIANVTKKTHLTISIIACIFVMPIFINTKSLSKFFANIVEVLPINALKVTYILRQQAIYNVLSKGILRGYFAPVILIIGTLMVIPLIVKRYKKLSL